MTDGRSARTSVQVLVEPTAPDGRSARTSVQVLAKGTAPDGRSARLSVQVLVRLQPLEGAGSANAAAAASAQASVLKSVTGSANAASAANAVGNTGETINVGGSANAASAAEAATVRKRGVTGSADNAAAAKAEIGVRRQVAGSANAAAAATAQGELANVINAAATANNAATASAQATVTKSVAGTANSAATAVANAATLHGAAGSANAVSVVAASAVRIASAAGSANAAMDAHTNVVILRSAAGSANNAAAAIAEAEVINVFVEGAGVAEAASAASAEATLIEAHSIAATMALTVAMSATVSDEQNRMIGVGVVTGSGGTVGPGQGQSPYGIKVRQPTRRTILDHDLENRPSNIITGGSGVVTTPIIPPPTTNGGGGGGGGDGGVGGIGGVINQTATLYLGAAADMVGYNKTLSYVHLMNGGAANPGSGTGQLGSRRCYNQENDGIPEWSQSAAVTDIASPYNDNIGLGCKSTWISFKPNLTNFVNGQYNGDLVRFVESVPDGHRVLITLWHEPEDNFTTAQQRADYRKMQKIAHRLVVSNRGSKEIYFGPCYNDHLFDEDSFPHDDLSDFWPVYDSNDIIPGGFAVNDPAFDFVGFDFYDRDRDWSWAQREWDPIIGGNPNGMTGYLDKIVSEARLTKPSFSRSDVVWACGEIGTKRGRTDDAPYSHPQDPVVWWDEIVNKALSDPSTCLELDWFHNDSEGDAAPWDMQEGIQQWIKRNGAEFPP